MLCAARGGRGELGVAARVARSARAPFAPFCAALSTRLADELRDKAHAYCAAADYADAEAHQEEADAVPEAYLGAVQCRGNRGAFTVLQAASMASRIKPTRSRI